MHFRHNFTPGDIGYLTYLHGILYEKEFGYDKTFEAYVAKVLSDFVLSFDPDMERIWLVEVEEKIIGSIAIAKFSKEEAQLRFYLVHPDYRGQGLGKILMREALQFCREKGYKSVFLLTANELTAAAHLYTKAGFIKTEEESHVIWGGFRTEERYELEISK
jgi:ribosomal protein S18 acetylase RimI-like enzyme